MATVVKDLGAVTAYAYAVAGGYSGTEAEFEALLGNIAEDLSEIENLSVTVTTLPAGSSATASYSNGVLSLGIPKGDKGDKGNTGATGATGPTGNGISTITKTGTSGLVDTYTITFTNGDTTTFTVTNGEDGEVTTAQMNAAIEAALEDYAKVDGSYSSLTSGNAEQLVSTVGVEDKTPYLFRTTGGSADVGDRVKLSEITGGTVAWNQLYPTSATASAYGLTTNTVNGKLTISGTTNSTGNREWTLLTTEHPSYKSIPSGHKVFVSAAPSPFRYRLPGATYAVVGKPAIFSVGANASNQLVLSLNPMTSGDEYNLATYPQVIDLTAMFGSTIADYIYSLEQNTAGAGVAWFRKLFPKDYYAYDAGSLLSVKTTAHKEYGFNAYDNSTGKAKVVGGQVYQITGTYTALSLDGSSITPDASGYFTPSASGEIMVTGGNATDTCIHLKWDGERDGEYEPYEANTYALDDVELRGIPKLDASNNLYYDGDSYAPDGTVTRKFFIKTFDGTDPIQVWYDADAEKNNWGFYINIPSKLNCGYGKPISPNFTAVSAVYATDSPWIMSIHNTAGTVGYLAFRIPKSVIGTPSDANDLVTKIKAWIALNQFQVQLELSTPTTETADPYQETQVCNDFGTEEFVDERTVPMPVGNSALYQANLRSKLEMAPDSPDGDGDYIVRQTDGLNEYVAVSSNSTISGLSTRCPACPTDTDGTFVLKATVSSGAVTYAWTAES